MSILDFPITQLPPEIVQHIDKFYNKYLIFYNLVLYEIYNPYKIMYSEIIKELAGKKIYTGKSKWIKLTEHITHNNTIITRKSLKINHNSYQPICLLQVYELNTSLLKSIYPENNTLYCLKEINSLF